MQTVRNRNLNDPPFELGKEFAQALRSSRIGSRRNADIGNIVKMQDITSFQSRANCQIRDPVRLSKEVRYRRLLSFPIRAHARDERVPPPDHSGIFHEYAVEKSLVCFDLENREACFLKYFDVMPMLGVSKRRDYFFVTIQPFEVRASDSPSSAGVRIMSRKV